MVIRPLSNIRWLAHANAVKALKENYKSTELVLELIMDNSEQSAEVMIRSSLPHSLMKQYIAQE